MDAGTGQVLDAPRRRCGLRCSVRYPMSEVGNKDEGIRSWNRQESAPVVPIEREQLRFLYAVLMLACRSISGFNKLPGIVSPRPGERLMGIFGGRVSPRGERRVYSSDFRPPCAVFLWVVVVVTLILAAPQVALASGEERTTVGDDLVIRTDTRWAGGTLGGYLPVRVEISNQAPARELVLEVTPSDRAHGATVKRVVRVDAHATVRFTLSIPLTAFRQGQLRVYDRRGELRSHQRLIGGAASLGVDTAPAMLVVSLRPVDCTG